MTPDDSFTTEELRRHWRRVDEAHDADDAERAWQQQVDERVEDLRRDYCPEDDPEAAERQARREAREDYEASEPWKDPSYWEGRDDADDS